jgi:hypothetical protein
LNAPRRMSHPDSASTHRAASHRSRFIPSSEASHFSCLVGKTTRLH